MKNRFGALFAAALLASALALHGCATTSPPPAPVAAFGHCVTAALKDQGQHLIGRVMTALATGDYVHELEVLAQMFGTDAVGCAVDLAIEQLDDVHAASPDPLVATMLTRAQAWRGANP